LTSTPPGSELLQDEYEPDDEFHTSENMITFGKSQSHTISPLNDVDYVLVNVENFTLEYKFSIPEATGPVSIRLRDLSQAVLFSDIVYPEGDKKPVRYIFDRAQLLYLELKTFKDLFVAYDVLVETGPPRILPDEYEDDNGPFSTHNRFPLGETQVHTFHNNHDRDFVILEINDVELWHLFSVSGVWDGIATPSPVMIIYQPNGGTPYFPLTGYRSSISVKFRDPGVYYLLVMDRKGTAGEYMLSITTTEEYTVP